MGSMDLFNSARPEAPPAAPDEARGEGGGEGGGEAGGLRSSDPRTDRLVAAYQHLSRDRLPALLALYAEQARFKDPFNDVTGRCAMATVFSHMFDTLVSPRFVVLSAITQGDQAFLTWDFHFRRSGSDRAWCIHGATQLHFDSAGYVRLHRDYWDAAEELYARLPLLGGLMRWLQRQLRTPQPALPPVPPVPSVPPTPGGAER